MGYQRFVHGSGLDVFTPREHAVLARWLGVAPLCADPPDFDAALEALAFPEAPDFAPGAAAVAGILLGREQDRLPAFTMRRGEELICSRPHRPVPIQRALLPKPVFLFALNWAMSGPGFDWPCEYRCTLVPGYDRRVVTVSFDGEDVCGAADVALGAFGPEFGLVEGSLEVIGRSWREEAAYDRECWQDFTRAGAISEEKAGALATQVWDSSEEDDDAWDNDFDEDGAPDGVDPDTQAGDLR